MKDKYLSVTIHDNDFTSSLQMIGELLYDIFQFEEKYPTEEDFLTLKEIIKYLWFGADMAQDLMRWGSLNSPNMKYFEPYLEFVNFEDIPDWDNHETIYIPMFDDGEIITK
jgi:hypothetical protein